MTVDILGQRLNEIQDVGVATYILDFFFCHLLLWLDSAEQDVEADCSSIQSWFLRHQCKLFAVFLYVKVRNKLVIKLDMECISTTAPSR
jgi:hypothetical protein